MMRLTQIFFIFSFLFQAYVEHQHDVMIITLAANLSENCLFLRILDEERSKEK